MLDFIFLLFLYIDFCIRNALVLLSSFKFENSFFKVQISNSILEVKKTFRVEDKHNQIFNFSSFYLSFKNGNYVKMLNYDAAYKYFALLMKYKRFIII